MNEKEKICFDFITLASLIKRSLDNSAGMKYAEKYTGNNIWILGYLFHNQERDIFQRDIEEHFSVRRSTVSKAIKLMVQKGLIKRELVEYDARLKKLTPTEKAVQIGEIVNGQMKEIGDKFVGGLTHEEVEALSEILVKIRKNFEKEI